VYKILYRNPIYFCPTTAALVVSYMLSLKYTKSTLKIAKI